MKNSATSAAKKPSKPRPSSSSNGPAEGQPPTDSPTARVFFALWPSTANAASLAEIARVEATLSGGRPTRQVTIHLTLAFLGDIPETRLPALIAAAQTVRAAPFALELDHLGYWRHNRIRWAGCTNPPPELGDLVDRLREALNAADFAVDRSHADFVPHITLLRKCIRPTAGQTIEPPLHWPADEFVLVRSRLDDEGANYERLSGFGLAG